jgi:transcription antitermination factor NusG
MPNGSIDGTEQPKHIEPIWTRPTLRPEWGGTPASAGNWYAIHTRHQHEKTIGRHLQQLGFDVFVPLYRAVHQWKDRRKQLDLPLFPCYVFFAGDLSRRFEILNTPGVFSLVASAGKPAIIPQAELEAVRTAAAIPERVEPHDYWRCGERVRIVTGPMAGLEGLVARKTDSVRVVLSVEMLCRSVAVEVAEALLERVACR